jgi:hypothetical protein
MNQDDDPCDEVDDPEEIPVDIDFMERHFADCFALYSNAASTIIRFGWRNTRDEPVVRMMQEIRLPTPVAKLLAVMLRRRLRDDEMRAGYTIELPQEVLDAYDIKDIEWRQGWWKNSGEDPSS